MNTQTPKQVLIERITEVLNTPTENLIRNWKGNNNNGILLYNEIESKVEELKNYLVHLNIDNITELPESRFTILQQKLKPVLDELEKIQTTEKNPNQSDHQQKQPTIQFFTYAPNQGGNNYFEREKGTIWDLILEAITLENRKLRDTSESFKKSKELDKLLQGAKESQEKINEVLNSARTELSKGGVNKHSGIFEEQALEHKQNGETWKINIIVLLIVNVLIIVSILFSVIWFIEERSVRIEVGIFGAILISLISYAIVLCTKNYFAEKHNQNINKHRANCLGTYNTFVDSADEERKAAILLHATNTIFSHQTSGYLARESEPNNPNPIIEVIRNVTKNGKE